MLFYRKFAHSESQRATFEQQVYPYSVVYGYVNNFLFRLANASNCSTTVVVLAMPENYKELKNQESQKNLKSLKNLRNQRNLKNLKSQQVTQIKNLKEEKV